MRTTILGLAMISEIGTQKDVFILDGTRYHRIDTQSRLGTRGSVNLFDIPKAGTPNETAYMFQRHSESYPRMIGLETEVVGDGDVWFTQPQRFTAPHLLASNAVVKEVPAGLWYNGLNVDTLIFDWHVVMHARGKEGGGRGKTERLAAVEYIREIEDGFDASGLHVVGANTEGLFDSSGEWVPGKHLLDKVIPINQTLYIAGKSFIFSNREEVLAAREAGLVGELKELRTISPAVLDMIREHYMDHGLEGADLERAMTRVERQLSGEDES